MCFWPIIELQKCIIVAYTKMNTTPFSVFIVMVRFLSQLRIIHQTASFTLQYSPLRTFDRTHAQQALLCAPVMRLVCRCDQHTINLHWYRVLAHICRVAPASTECSTYNHHIRTSDCLRTSVSVDVLGGECVVIFAFEFNTYYACV